MLSAVLKGHYPGIVILEDNSTQCLVRNNEGFTFYGGEVDENFLGKAIPRLANEGVVIFVRPSDLTFSLPEPRKVIRRLEFDGLSKTIPLEIARRESGKRIVKRIDEELIESCKWKGKIESACGSVTNFLKHGIGLCLIRNGDILSEAYAPFFGYDMRVELGIFSNENYRREGNATYACANLMKLCIDKGYSPYWSCDDSNSASISLAKKLGFRNPTNYDLLIY